MHTLFINEHNRLAGILSKDSPSLSNDEIYEIVRKIVGAEIQNIVYNEFLPLVLGNETMSRYNLYLPQDFSENTNYNQSTDPTVSNEFATVAFRFGHSLIPSILIPSSQPIRKGSISCSLR